MKSCATGLIVRFFKVTIPTVLGSTGKRIGNALMDIRRPLSDKSELGRMVR